MGLGENHSRIIIWGKETERAPSWYKLTSVIQNWEETELWVKRRVSTDSFALRAASVEKLHL